MSFSGQGWKLSEGASQGEQSPPSAHSKSHLLGWLRGFKGDPSKMIGLRAMLNQHVPRDLSQFSDDEILDGIADLVAWGLLHVSAPAPAPLPKMVGGPTPPPPPPPPARSFPKPPTMPGLPKLEPPLLPNVAAQAAVLVAAAADATPFCPI
jgi:hypothetical protein